MTARAEGWPQHRKAEGAHAVWSILKKAKHPLLLSEMAAHTELSEPYLRKLIRLWSASGLVIGCVSEKAESRGRPAYALVPSAPDGPPIVTAKGEVLPRGTVFMTHDEFAAIRRLSGLTLADFGIAIGRQGKRANVAAEMNHYERGNRVIGEATAKKVKELGARMLAPPRGT